MRPTPRPRPEAQAQAVRALLTRRRQWCSSQRRRRCRGLADTGDVQASPAERRLARTEADLAAALRSTPLGRAKDEMRQSTPGVGPMLARRLVAEVPALGALNRPEIAALMGVAPLHHDRGTWRGIRAVWGGRAQVRAVLYMRPLAAVRHNAVLQAFDERRRAVGTAPQGALTACMRMLLTMRNARLKHQTPWHEHYAHHS